LNTTFLFVEQITLVSVNGVHRTEQNQPTDTFNLSQRKTRKMGSFVKAGGRSSYYWHYLVAGMAGVWLWWNLSFGRKIDTTFYSRITAADDIVVEKVLESSCTDFRDFPSPEHHSGLPYLADAFASHDAETVTFVARNRGKCEEEWRQADSYATYRDEEYHRFVCVFHASGHENITVLSDYVLSTNPHDPVYLIRCKLPRPFRFLVTAGQTTTTLHVDLHSMEDPESEKKGRNVMRQFPSSEIGLLPRIPNIALCHPASAHTTKEKDLPANAFKLIGYLPITSSYALDSRKGAENSTQWSSAHRLPEWIDWHAAQGFDHFVIYDNDREPHGPIEQILKEHIDSGLVSYRWFPIQNCMSSIENRRMDEAQISGSMAALHRVGYTAEYLSYTDGDEFLVPLEKDKTVQQIATQVFEANPSLAAIEWRPTVMAPCNGANVKAYGSILHKWQCKTDQHYADIKLIVRTSTMFYFCIHYAILTKNGDTAETIRLDDATQGYLAHFRAENDAGSTTRDSYSGVVESRWNDRVDYFDDFLAKAKATTKQQR